MGWPDHAQLDCIQSECPTHCCIFPASIVWFLNMVKSLQYKSCYLTLKYNISFEYVNIKQHSYFLDSECFFLPKEVLFHYTVAANLLSSDPWNTNLLSISGFSNSGCFKHMYHMLHNVKVQIISVFISPWFLHIMACICALFLSLTVYVWDK